MFWASMRPSSGENYCINATLALLCFFTVIPCIISQINPTRCTILFNIFIYFSSPHVLGVHVPIIRRKLLYQCNTGTCHSVWLSSGLLVGLEHTQLYLQYLVLVKPLQLPAATAAGSCNGLTRTRYCSYSCVCS